jgi:hypothetical protein
MANPNIVEVTNINGAAGGYMLGTTAGGMTLAVPADTVWKINTITVANVTATACWVSVWRYTNSIAGPYGTSSIDGYIAYQVSIPGKSSLSVIDKSISIYLNEGHKISAMAELGSSLHFHASWEVIS